MVKIFIYFIKGNSYEKVGEISDTSNSLSGLRILINEGLKRSQGVDYDVNSIKVNIIRSNWQYLTQILNEDEYRNFYITYRQGHKSGISILLKDLKKKSIATSSNNYNFRIQPLSLVNQNVSNPNVDKKIPNSISNNESNINNNSMVQEKIPKLLDEFITKFSMDQQEKTVKYLNDNLFELLKNVPALRRKPFTENFIQSIYMYIRPKNSINTNIKCTKCNNYIFGKIYSCTSCNNKFCDLCYSKNLYFLWDPHDFVVSFPDKSQNIYVAKISKRYREHCEQVQRMEKVYEVMERDFKVSKNYYESDIYSAIYLGGFDAIEAMKILESKKKIHYETIDELLSKYKNKNIFDK